MGRMSVRDVLENGDFDAFAAALAADVVWVGVLPGQLCRTREQVLGTFTAAIEAGCSGHPEVVAESEGMLVVDPHVDPPLEDNPQLHHVFVVENDLIVEMRDFRDRSDALRAVGVA